MKVPVEWVRTFGDFASLSDHQLKELLTMAGLEVEEVHGEGASTVFVTKVTPNRGDWMSMFGVAREASAASELPLNPPAALPLLPVADRIGDLTVRVEDSGACPRYGAAVLTTVQHTSSPKYIQDRLALSGMRSINAVVDITNFVMLELGQPLHAYDAAKITSNSIIVRRARSGEKILTLDGIERVLTEDLLVIADSLAPLGIAGIMGGADSEVTETTSEIVLEAAHFDPGAIRRAAKLLGLSTEASYRFERFVDPNLIPVAIARAAELLTEHADATLVDAFIDTSPEPNRKRTIHVRTARVNAVLGLDLSTLEVAKCLSRLGMSVHFEHDHLQITIPTFRPDLVKEIDIVEEVGRMVGYWNLPETLPSISGGGGSDFEIGLFETRIRNILVGQGLTETYSHTLGAVSTFDRPEDEIRRVRIRSSLSSELSGLRLTLLPHLLDAIALNLRHGVQEIRFFEVGKVFYQESVNSFDEPRHVAAALTGPEVDYLTIKGVVQNLAYALGLGMVEFTAEPRWSMHSGRSASITIDGIDAGFVAEVDPYKLAEALDLPHSTGRVAVFELNVESLLAAAEAARTRKYVPLPKYPAVTRDIALVYDLNTVYGSIEKVATEAVGIVLQGITLLSIYTGEKISEGKKSVAIRLTLRSLERTLTDGEASAAVDAAKTALVEKLGAELR